MGFFIEVAPGVRIKASRRGVRTSVGARAGRSGVAGHAEPIGFYTALGRSGGRPRGAAEAHAHMRTSPQVHAVPPPVETAAPRHPKPDYRLDDQIEHALNLHRVQFAQVRAPVAANPLLQRSLDERWHLLCANDPEVVIETLDAAFEDNEAPAAAVNADVDGAEVSLVVVVPPMDRVFPEDRVVHAGRPGLLYAAFVCGQALVTVREALAVAPGMLAARVVMLRNDGADVFGHSSLTCLLAARFERATLDQVLWHRASSVAIVEQAASELAMNLRGVDGAQELEPVDLAHEPKLAELIRSVDFDEMFAAEAVAQLRSSLTPESLRTESGPLGESAEFEEFLRGQRLEGDGDVIDACAAYHNVAASSRRDAAALGAMALGTLLAARGDTDNARAAFEQVVRTEDAEWTPQAELGLGYLFADAGDLPAARTMFQRAADSGHPKAAPQAEFEVAFIGFVESSLDFVGHVDSAESARSFLTATSAQVRKLLATTTPEFDPKRFVAMFVRGATQQIGSDIEDLRDSTTPEQLVLSATPSAELQHRVHKAQIQVTCVEGLAKLLAAEHG